MQEHARIMEALEAAVSNAEALGVMTGQWKPYDVAYRAYSAFHHAENPIQAAWAEVAEAAELEPMPDRLRRLRDTATEIERSITAITLVA